MELKNYQKQTLRNLAAQVRAVLYFPFPGTRRREPDAHGQKDWKKGEDL